MRIVGRFAWVFFVVATLCLLGSAYLSARRSAARVDAIEVADLQSLGGGLRAGFREIWAAKGEAAAIAFLDVARKDAPEGTFLAQWVPGPAQSPVRVEEAPGGRRASVALPLTTPTGVEGAIVLTRRLPDTRAILREELLAELGPAATLAVAGLLLVVVLGGLLIGGPLHRIAAQARRIGAGDLSQRLREDAPGELGELKRTLNTMCDQLVSARDQLEREETLRLETLQQLRHLDRLGTIGTIASGVAHELGTPLNVVMLWAHSLTHRELGPAQVRDAGAMIARQVDKMTAIVRQLLGFARRDGGARAPVALADVAHEAERLLGHLARKARCRVVVEVDGEGPVVRADRAQLVQVVTNLLVNALHAMPDGGAVVLRVGERREGEQRWASLEVADEGVGMPEAVAARVFEPFFTTKAAGKGTGLGLAVAKGIVDEHDGTLSVTSVEGEGTTFELRLPALDGTA